LREFTGISAPYETPEHPQLAIDSGHESIAASVQQLVAYVERNLPLDAKSAPRA
jgi:adenylylsulfate kinase